MRYQDITYICKIFFREPEFLPLGEDAFQRPMVGRTKMAWLRPFAVISKTRGMSWTARSQNDMESGG